MITINDIIETALAVDALQTHVDDDAVGVDVRLRPAMERCAPAALAAVQAECATADATAERVEDILAAVPHITEISQPETAGYGLRRSGCRACRLLCTCRRRVCRNRAQSGRRQLPRRPYAIVDLDRRLCRHV